VEAKKVNSVAWREDDFDEHRFDSRMFASGSANTSIIETKSCFPIRNLGTGDLIYFGPGGKIVTVEIKADPRIEDKYVLMHDYRIAQRQVPASVIYTSIVLSRSLIDEPYRYVEASTSASSVYEDFWERKQHQNEGAIHLLTRSVYEQLEAVSGNIREAMRVILNEFATSVPKHEMSNFPTLRLASLEDSSYLLEWTFRDRRLGFSFEPNQKDSGWYFVFSNGSSEHCESGTMDQLEMARLISMMLKS